MAEGKKKSTLWNFLDNLEGDKVVWMIVLLLMLISIVAIFSSTSQLALSQNTSRMAIVGEQMLITLIGFGVILACYSIRSIGFFRVLSQFGYLISIALLLILAGHKQIGPIKPLMINSAWRIVSIGGFQLHVFEVVKIAMVMYLAWAVNAYRNDKFMEDMRELLVTTNLDRQKELLTEMDGFVTEDLPVYSLHFANNIVSMRKEVKGFEYRGGMTNVNQIYFE